MGAAGWPRISGQSLILGGILASIRSKSIFDKTTLSDIQRSGAETGFNTGVLYTGTGY